MAVRRSDLVPAFSQLKQSISLLNNVVSTLLCLLETGVYVCSHYQHMQLVAHCCFSYQRSLRYMIHDKIMYIICLRRVFYEHNFSVEQHIVCIEGLLQWACQTNGSVFSLLLFFFLLFFALFYHRSWYKDLDLEYITHYMLHIHYY